MAIDGRLLGGGPGIPPTPASEQAALAPLVPTEPLGGPALPTDAGEAAAASDHREIGTSTQLGGPNNPASKRLDFEAAASEEIRGVLPGARLTGPWNPLQVADLKGAITRVPPRLLPRLHGTEFQLRPALKDLPEAMVQSTLSPKTVAIHPEAFDLPALDGTPGLQIALMAEFGRLMNDKPQQVLEFGQLSGWKQTVFDRLGNVLQPAEPATGFAPGEPLPGVAAPAKAAPGTAASRGTQRLVPPEPSRLPPPPRGTGRLSLGGAPSPEPGPAGPALPRTQEATAAGSRVHYSNETVVEYAFQADARFAPGAASKTDPRADFSEALRRYAFQPETLLGSAPEKFLYLNADARQYPIAAVRRMADTVGVDLPQVMTTMALTGRVPAAALARIGEAHGLTAEASLFPRVAASPTGALARLADRLALDIGLHGAATTRLLSQGQRLSERYHALTAALPDLTPRPAFTGGIVSALIGKAAAGLAEARLGRLDRDLAEVRAQFTRLPLVVQLRVDPRLALGAGWFALPADDRTRLLRPESVQQLIAAAAGVADDRSYIPQQLTPNERRVLAGRTIIDALFDPSSEGGRFRSRLAGMPLVEGSFKRLEHNPEAALKALVARNGESAWSLLAESDRRFFQDRGTPALLKQLLGEGELPHALAVLREGTAGAEALRAALLRFGLDGAPAAPTVKAVLEGALGTVRETRDQQASAQAGPPLERALAEVHRRVAEQDIHFVQRFLGPAGTDRVAALLGPWAWSALSPAERRLFESADHRRVLVEEAQGTQATGRSLAVDAARFSTETAALQEAVGNLLQPDAAYRRDFEADPVGTLLRHGVWDALPHAARSAVSDLQPKGPTVAAFVAAVQLGLAPVLAPSPERARRLENLRQAVSAINAGNYRALLALWLQPEAELERGVVTGLGAALDGHQVPRPGGPLTFV